MFDFIICCSMFFKFFRIFHISFHFFSRISFNSQSSAEVLPNIEIIFAYPDQYDVPSPSSNSKSNEPACPCCNKKSRASCNSLNFFSHPFFEFKSDHLSVSEIVHRSRFWIRVSYNMQLRFPNVRRSNILHTQSISWRISYL